MLYGTDAVQQMKSNSLLHPAQVTLPAPHLRRSATRETRPAPYNQTPRLQFHNALVYRLLSISCSTISGVKYFHHTPFEILSPPHNHSNIVPQKDKFSPRLGSCQAC